MPNSSPSHFWLCATLLPLIAPTLATAQTHQTATQTKPNDIAIEVFVRGDSKRCDQAIEYLRTLTGESSGRKLVVHDVLEDSKQLRRLWNLSKQGGHKKPTVPAVYCCQRLRMGFDDAKKTGPHIQDLYTMHVYTRRTCPRCAKAKQFLSRLHPQWPGLRIVEYEVTDDVAARNRWQALCNRYRVLPGLPTIHFARRLVVGFQGDQITGVKIEKLLRQVDGLPDAPRSSDSLSHARQASTNVAMASVPSTPRQSDSPTATDQDDVPALPEEQTDDVPLPDESGFAGDEVIPEDGVLIDDGLESDSINVPLLGELRVSSLGLPAFTFLVGLIDGFNPCAMWILVFLLSVLVNVKDRRKMILIAGTFVVVSGLAYFTFMAAWLNLFMLVGIARPIQVLLGCVAIVIGVVNVKDFFAFGKGFSFSIPESKKPALYKRVNKIVTARYLTAALWGAIALAIAVNIVELLCTAGLPALYTQILTMQKLAPWQNYGYLALYNVAYMLDDAALLSIAVATLSRRKIQEREGRWLKLLSGATILALGLTMLFKPELLQLGV